MKDEESSLDRVKPIRECSKPLLLPTLVALYMVASTNMLDSASAQTPNNQPNKPLRRMDMSKSAIEIPLKRLIKSEDAPLAPHIPDISKIRIEAPVKSMMRRNTAPDLFKTIETRALLNPNSKSGSSIQTKHRATVSISGTASGADMHTPGVVAPRSKVKPGLVTWRKDMADAMNNSAKSGKPVLVFHMMGSMDDRFC